VYTPPAASRQRIADIDGTEAAVDRIGAATFKRHCGGRAIELAVHSLTFFPSSLPIPVFFFHSFIQRTHAT